MRYSSPSTCSRSTPTRERPTPAPSSPAASPETTDAWITGYQVVRGGSRVDFDDATVREALRREVVDLEISLGVGTATARAYGCDLTKGYIDENAAYYSS